MKIIPNYHPPSDYRRPTKTQEKVYVPVNDYPEINFSTITNPILTLSFSSFLLMMRGASLEDAASVITNTLMLYLPVVVTCCFAKTNT